jgi:hypothetical protein
MRRPSATVHLRTDMVCGHIIWKLKDDQEVTGLLARICSTRERNDPDPFTARGHSAHNVLQFAVRGVRPHARFAMAVGGDNEPNGPNFARSIPGPASLPWVTFDQLSSGSQRKL